MRLAGFYHSDQGVQVAHASPGGLIGGDHRPGRIEVAGHEDDQAPVSLAPEAARYRIDISGEATAADIDRTGVELPESLLQPTLMPGK